MIKSLYVLERMRKNKFSINPVKMPDGSITGSFVSFVLCLELTFCSQLPPFRHLLSRLSPTKSPFFLTDKWTFLMMFAFGK